MADNYAPQEITVNVGGQRITGFLSGTFVSVERETPSFRKVVGSDGEVARIGSANKTGLVTLTLMSTSDSNDLLSALLRADEETFSGQFTFSLYDTLGTTKIVAPSAWIANYANIEYGDDDIAGREWTIELGNYEHFVGSN